MTRTLLLLAVLIPICACSKDSGKPQAKLKYEKIERVNLDAYVITYTSNMDLLHIFDGLKEAPQAGTRLICSLDGDHAFSSEHVIKKTFTASVFPGKKTSTAEFTYQTLGTLRLNSNNGSSRLLSLEELGATLRDHENVSCRIYISAPGHDAYYSQTMSIPSSAILEEVEKSPRIWIEGAGTEYLPSE